MELETALVGPGLNCLFIHLPCEDEWLIGILLPHAGYFLANPIPLPVPPKTVGPPAVHTAPDERRIELTVFALFVQEVQ